jgi:hypothetical protein
VSDHLSNSPEKLSAIYDNMMTVMNSVIDKSMKAEDGETIAKAGHVACKTIEVDLHARIFADKIASNMPALPNKGNGASALR